jgi:transketolase
LTASISIEVDVVTAERLVTIVQANATALTDSVGRRWARRTGKRYGAQEWLTRDSLAAVESAISAAKESR